MASESPDGPVTVALPEPLAEWLEGRATETGVDRDELLSQLVAAYRVTAERDTGGVDERLETLEADFDAKIEDVRSRVLQVKDIAEERAEADHSHAELGAVHRLKAEVDTLAEGVDDLTDRVEGDNQRAHEFEERLDEVESRVVRLAHAVVRLRGKDVGEAERRLTDLKQRAAEANVERARCVACERDVHLGLITAAECPHCGVAVGGIEERQSLFGPKARLTGVGSGDE